MMSHYRTQTCGFTSCNKNRNLMAELYVIFVLRFQLCQTPPSAVHDNYVPIPNIYVKLYRPYILIQNLTVPENHSNDFNKGDLRFGSMKLIPALTSISKKLGWPNTFSWSPTYGCKFSVTILNFIACYFVCRRECKKSKSGWWALFYGLLVYQATFQRNLNKLGLNDILKIMEVSILNIIINQIKRTKMVRSSQMHFADHSFWAENNLTLWDCNDNI
jgi:hypothetical protein